MFDIYKTLSLSKYGEEWKDCYVKFRAISVKEAQKLADLKGVDEDKASELIVDILQTYFVEGYAISEGKRVEVKKEDIEKLPLEVLFDAVQLFNPQLDEKKKSE